MQAIRSSRIPGTLCAWLRHEPQPLRLDHVLHPIHMHRGSMGSFKVKALRVMPKHVTSLAHACTINMGHSPTACHMACSLMFMHQRESHTQACHQLNKEQSPTLEMD